MPTFIVLFRAINAGIKLPMAEARACVDSAGFGNVRSYIASGNLLVDADEDGGSVERRIEAAIRHAMGVSVEAIVRDAAAWAALAAANPFREAADERPKLLHLLLSKHPLAGGAAALLASRCTAGERVAEAGGALWIDYDRAVGSSRLTPRAIDRAAGSTAAGRNWNTVVKLAELAGIAV